MMRKLRYPLFVWIILLFSATTLAQGTCPVIVQEALAQVDTICQATERNQACYGNVALNAQPKANVQNFNFQTSGDIVNIGDIESIRTQGLSESNGDWGVALLRLQADIPNSLPGQNVTFLIFGDVTITSTAAEGQPPMQSFILTTGVGDARCTQAPDSGLLVQTPAGVEEVSFNVNGVDMQVGSTELLQAQPGKEMTVTGLEGSAVATINGKSYAAIGGTQLRIPLGDDGMPSGVPARPQAYRNRDIVGIPLDLLERDIDPVDPFDDETLQILYEQIDAGEAPCGVEGLPDCETFSFFDDEFDWADEAVWGDDLDERFPDWGDARVDENGYIIFEDGERCATDIHVNAGDIPACSDIELPDDVFLPDSFEDYGDFFADEFDDYGDYGDGYGDDYGYGEYGYGDDYSYGDEYGYGDDYGYGDEYGYGDTDDEGDYGEYGDEEVDYGDDYAEDPYGEEDIDYGGDGDYGDNSGVDYGDSGGVDYGDDYGGNGDDYGDDYGD